VLTALEGLKQARDWRKVNTNPERWQRPGSGTIEARGETLWAVIATCGHTYATVSLGWARPS
jgi:hypothetical protein